MSATKAMDRTAALERSLAALEEGKRAVEEAEARLQALLTEIQVAPRAEKTAVSTAVESALDRLGVARVRVVDAEAVIATVKASED